MKIPKLIEGYTPEFWEGRENTVIRFWVYLHRGLGLVNDCRYWILGTLGLYAVLKLTNPIFLVIMFIVSTPILIVLGRWQLYKVAKTQEFVTTVTGTVTGYSQFNLMVRNTELLQEISDKLDRL